MVRAVVTAPSKFELLELVSWLLKESFWVLLLPQALLFGLIAIFAISGQIFVSKWNGPDGENAGLVGGEVRIPPGLAALGATLLWLCGNFVWCVSELLYEPYDKLTVTMGAPYTLTPALGRNPHMTETLVQVAGALFVVALLTAAYEVFRLTLSRERQPEEAALFWPTFWWIAKDLFWLYELFAPAMIAAVFVYVFLTYACVTVKEGRPVCGALIFWMGGNSLWLVAESEYLGPLPFQARYFCAAPMAVGLFTLLFWQYLCPVEKRAED